MRVPAPQDRPTLDAARRLTWKGWLLQEWGLMLLAAVLAVLVWQITADKVIDERTIERVRIELFVPEADRERIGAVLETEGTTTTVRLKGSERARFAVDRALRATGDGQPVLRLRVSPNLTAGSAKRPLNPSTDVWMWPVDNAEEIALQAELRPGVVYRLEREQQGAIAVPALTTRTQETATKKGIAVDVEISRRTFAYLAPEEVITGRRTPGSPALLVPDPLHLHDILDAEDVPFGKTLQFDLSFNGWREARDADTGIQAVVRNYRQFLALPKVKATVVLRQIGVLADEGKGYTKNQLVVQLDPKYQWEIDPQTVDGVLHGSTWQFAGTLVGPFDLLQKIRDNKGDWNWQVWVKEPDGGWPTSPGMSDEPSPWTETTGEIQWVPKRKEWRGQGISFRPEARQDSIPIKVRLYPRK